ncbi:MAG: caspase family protein, partial [Bacteroidota bacterium]
MSEKGISKYPKTTPPPPGSNHLLLIAIDQYGDGDWLKNPVSDLQKLKELLLRRYQFTTQNVVFLQNGEATKTGILAALDDCAKRLSEADQFYIAFSGHGEHNEVEERSFWVASPPKNVAPTQDDWLPDGEIFAKLNHLQCRQIVLIVDACFAGAILDTEQKRGFRYKNHLTAPYLLASGGIQRVDDDDGQSASPFMRRLLQALEEHEKGSLYLDDLAKKVLSDRPWQTLQRPFDGQLKSCGVAGDRFFLSLRPEAERTAPQPFKIIPAGDLQPKDLMPLRASEQAGFRKWYLRRAYLDDRLHQNFFQGRHTLIAGKPLAGKTRTVLQFLTQLGLPDLPVLLPQNIHALQENFDLPGEGRAVLVLDELDRFLEMEGSDRGLEKLLATGRIFVLATCWASKVKEVRDGITRFFHLFDTLEVQPLTGEETRQVLHHAPDKNYLASDGTVGGYFLRPDEMQKRFDNLPGDSLEREILRTCKVLFVWRKQVAYSA